MAALRILVDGYNLSLPTGTGIATYARGLAAAARALGNDVGILYGPPNLPADPMLRGMAFFEQPNIANSAGPVQKYLHHIRLAFAARRRIVASPIVLGDLVISRSARERLPAHDRIWAVANFFDLAQTHYAASGRFLEIAVPETPDIVHWTYAMPIRVAGAKNIYTIHDLVPFLLPDATRVNKGSFLALHRKIVAEADHIITVSENSKRDITRLFGLPDDRVTNTYQSIDLPPAATTCPLTQVREEIEYGYGLPFGEYFLYFGAIEPKKNVARIIQAYLQSGVRGPLAIVGKLAWDSEREARLLADPATRYATPLDSAPEIRRGLKHLDYVPRMSLVSLIRGAKAVLFPSLYEGFGLPALEAMQLGTPVLASTQGALPEVCGDAALLVDPYDIAALAGGIRRLDTDGDLRVTLARDGPRQAQRFSADCYAARIDALYQRLTNTQSH